MATVDPYVPAAIGLTGVLVGAIANGFFNRREAQRKESQALRSAARLLTEDLAEAFDELRQDARGAVFLANGHAAVDRALRSWSEFSAVIASGATSAEWSTIRVGFRLLRDIRNTAADGTRRTARTGEPTSWDAHYLEAAASATDRLALRGDKRTDRWAFEIKRSIEKLLLRAEADPSYRTAAYVTPWIRADNRARETTDETAAVSRAVGAEDDPG